MDQYKIWFEIGEKESLPVVPKKFSKMDPKEFERLARKGIPFIVEDQIEVKIPKIQKTKNDKHLFFERNGIQGIGVAKKFHDNFLLKEFPENLFTEMEPLWNLKNCFLILLSFWK